MRNLFIGLVTGILTMQMIFFAVPTEGCELPAYPRAAAVPINTQGQYTNMKLASEVIGGRTVWFYIVPQGTEIEFLTLWDPYGHNGARSSANYIYVRDWTSYPPESRATAIAGFSYYPTSAMSDFFRVRGLRGDLVEAFTRQYGSLPPSNRFLPASSNLGGVTVDYSMSQFMGAFMLSNSDDVAVTFISSTADGYGNPSTLVDLSDGLVDLTEGSNMLPPNVSTSLDPDPIPELPIATSNPRPSYTRVSYKPGTAGIYMGDLELDVTPILPEDYKVYIDEPAVWVDLDPSTSNIRIGEENALGHPDSFTLRFDTPTIGLGGERELIKIRNTAPPAGFELKNIWWCWEEETNRYIATDTNNDGFYNAWILAPGYPQTRRSSVGMEFTFSKPGDSSGFTGIKVYDSKPPVTSKLTLAQSDPFLTGGPMEPVDFIFKMADSNPYGNLERTVEIKVAGNDRSFSQSEAILKSNLKAFYAYPVYEYDLVGNLGINEIIEETIAGPVNLTEPLTPMWHGIRYLTKWLWKEAEVDQSSLSIDFEQTSTDGRLSGGVWTIEGKLNFSQPTPWHYANEGPSRARTDRFAEGHPNLLTANPEKLMKVFMIASDSAGRALAEFGAISALDQTEEYDTAHSDFVGMPVVNPINNQVLVGAAGELPPIDSAIQLVHAPDAPSTNWQTQYQYLAVEDKTPPEIQVIIFDTRNNRYHTFGNRDGGIARYTGFFDDTPTAAPRLEKDYSALNPWPYNADDLQTLEDRHRFNNFDDPDAMFNKFFDRGNQGGVSMLTDEHRNKGFVCQRNTALIFYIRAWDNINTFAAEPLGISEIEYSIIDETVRTGETPPAGIEITSDIRNTLFNNPLRWQFRSPNIDSGGGITARCALEVKATDHNRNSSELIIEIGVVESELQIRTLEERRRRITD